jgi:DNA-binding winged helix-turn-helix (wHTH) protein
MIETPSHDYTYEFAGFAFSPAQRTLLRLNDGTKSSLTPQQSEFLFLLLVREGETVTYSDLKASIWPDDDDGIDVRPRLREVKHVIKKNLGNMSKCIQTVQNIGYRLIIPEPGLRVVAKGVESDQPVPANAISEKPVDPGLPHDAAAQLIPPKSASKKKGVNRHWPHIFFSSAIYGTLYVVALFMEIAYRFDDYGPGAILLYPLVFLWIFGSTVFCFWWAWRSSKGATGKIFVPLLLFLVAGIAVYAALGNFLPSVPITEASFQTYPAHSAYLKDVAYFLLLGVIFLLWPFHQIRIFELADRKLGPGTTPVRAAKFSPSPEGASYLKVWWLVVALFLAAVIWLIMTAHLLDNLKSNRYMNLFVQLTLWRAILCLILGLKGLIWYHHNLEVIRQGWR